MFDDWTDEDWSLMAMSCWDDDFWLVDEFEDEEEIGEYMDNTTVLKNAIGLVKTNIDSVEDLIARSEDVRTRLYKTHEVLTDLLLEVEDSKPIDPQNCLHPKASRVTTKQNGAETITCRDCSTLLSFRLI